MDIEKLKYPIGRFAYDPAEESTDQAIERISALPARLRAAAEQLDDAQLDTPYRPGGWTLRQVIHHLPDSHTNAYVRIKLTVTEDNPTIRPYDETAWAECHEARYGDIGLSLDLLDALHKRWCAFLRSLTHAQLSRTYFHPANGRKVELNEVLSMYAWHGDHHLAHITSTIVKMGW